MRLELSGVGKRYRGGVQALDGFSLVLESGVHGLLGPNGAGKSTLMRLIATVSRPDAGRILWNGVDVVRAPDTLRRELGYLPQDFGVYPNLTVIEFLDYLAAVKGVPAGDARRRIDALLEMTNLGDVRHRPLGGFSGGMRQRVGICQALVNDPKLLIVDEPTAGLDPEERARFSGILSELAADRVILLSTHIVSDVEAVAETLAIIDRGHLLAHATPDALLRKAEGRVWTWSVPPGAAEASDTAWTVVSRVRRSDGVHLRVLAPHAPVAGAMAVEPALDRRRVYPGAGARVRTPRRNTAALRGDLSHPLVPGSAQPRAAARLNRRHRRRPGRRHPGHDGDRDRSAARNGRRRARSPRARLAPGVRTRRRLPA
jgi:ABC-type multidrug transport system ATPase subunit